MLAGATGMIGALDLDIVDEIDEVREPPGRTGPRRRVAGSKPPRASLLGFLLIVGSDGSGSRPCAILLSAPASNELVEELR